MIDIAPAIDEAHSYKLLTDYLIGLLHIKEDAQLAIGDALKDVETVYSGCTIQGIADDIGTSASSLYSYRELAECFTPAMRAEYRAKDLMFSHLRSAYQLPAFEEIHDFLADCVAEKYTTTVAAIEVRSRRGYNAGAGYVFKGLASFKVERGQMVIEGLQGVRLESGKEYECVIREMR